MTKAVPAPGSFEHSVNVEQWIASGPGSILSTAEREAVLNNPHLPGNVDDAKAMEKKKEREERKKMGHGNRRNSSAVKIEMSMLVSNLVIRGDDGKRIAAINKHGEYESDASEKEDTRELERKKKETQRKKEEMEREKEELEIGKREKEFEKMKQRDLEREREKELVKKREAEQEKKREKEREMDDMKKWERARERALEREQDRVREREREWEIELVKKRESELESEKKRIKEREQELEQEQQKELEREKVRERIKELEREAEREREKVRELKKKLDKGRVREREEKAHEIKANERRKRAKETEHTKSRTKHHRRRRSSSPAAPPLSNILETTDSNHATTVQTPKSPLTPDIINEGCFSAQSSSDKSSPVPASPMCSSPGAWSLASTSSNSPPMLLKKSTSVSSGVVSGFSLENFQWNQESQEAESSFRSPSPTPRASARRLSSASSSAVAGVLSDSEDENEQLPDEFPSGRSEKSSTSVSSIATLHAGTESGTWGREVQEAAYPVRQPFPKVSSISSKKLLSPTISFALPDNSMASRTAGVSSPVERLSAKNSSSIAKLLATPDATTQGWAPSSTLALPPYRTSPRHSGKSSSAAVPDSWTVSGTWNQDVKKVSSPVEQPSSETHSDTSLSVTSPDLWVDSMIPEIGLPVQEPSKTADSHSKYPLRKSEKPKESSTSKPKSSWGADIKKYSSNSSLATAIYDPPLNTSKDSTLDKLFVEPYSWRRDSDGDSTYSEAGSPVHSVADCDDWDEKSMDGHLAYRHPFVEDAPDTPEKNGGGKHSDWEWSKPGVVRDV
jgi:hypothetical protein